MSFGDRLAALTRRERLFLGAGAAALLLFVIILVFHFSGSRQPDERVELAQVPPAPMQSPAPPPPPTAFAPPPAAMPTTTSSPPSLAQAPAAGGFVLYGIISGGPGGGAAIIGPAGGGQRAVRVGRPVGGGMVLKEIGAGYVLLSGPSGELRLDLAPTASTPAYKVTG